MESSKKRRHDDDNNNNQVPTASLDETDKDAGVDRSEPRGLKARAEGAVESDDEIDESPAAVSYSQLCAQSVLLCSIDDLLPPRSIQTWWKPVLTRPGEKKKQKKDVRFDDEKSKLVSAVHTVPASRAECLLPRLLKSDNPELTLEHILLTILRQPRQERPRLLKRCLRSVDKKLYDAWARESKGPGSMERTGKPTAEEAAHCSLASADAEDPDDQLPDPLSVYYITYDQFRELVPFVGEQEDEDDEDDPFAPDADGDEKMTEARVGASRGESSAPLSAHDSPAKCDTLHYSNQRVMKHLVIPWHERRVEAKRVDSGRALRLRGLLLDLQEQFYAGFTNQAQLDNARAYTAAFRHKNDDPRHNGNNRMLEMDWQGVKGRIAEGSLTRSVVEALEQLPIAATQAIRANALTLSDVQARLGELQDSMLKIVDSSRMILSAAAHDVNQPLTLSLEITCCDIQLALLNTLFNGRSIQFESYHPVLGTARSNALSRLTGMPPADARSALLRIVPDFRYDECKDANSFTGQSMAYFLAGASAKVADVCHPKEDDPVVYFADVQCIQNLKQKKVNRIRDLESKSKVQASHRSIEGMVNQLRVGVGSVGNANSGGGGGGGDSKVAVVPLSPAMLLPAPTESFELRQARVQRLREANAELGAIKESVSTLFEMIDQRGRNQKECVKELCEQFSMAALTPPFVEVLTGQRNANPEQFHLSKNSAAVKWLKQNDKRDSREAKDEMNIDREDEENDADDDDYEDDDLSAARRGDLVAAFPSSFELYHRANRLDVVLEDVSAVKEAAENAARDERAAKRAKLETAASTPASTPAASDDDDEEDEDVDMS